MLPPKPWKIKVTSKYGAIASIVLYTKWVGRCQSCHASWEYRSFETRGITARELALEHADTHARTCRKFQRNYLRSKRNA